MRSYVRNVLEHGRELETDLREYSHPNSCSITPCQSSILAVSESELDGKLE
jgi:hypothetical protein